MDDLIQYRSDFPGSNRRRWETVRDDRAAGVAHRHPAVDQLSPQVGCQLVGPSDLYELRSAHCLMLCHDGQPARKVRPRRPDPSGATSLIWQTRRWEGGWLFRVGPLVFSRAGMVLGNLTPRHTSSPLLTATVLGSCWDAGEAPVLVRGRQLRKGESGTAERHALTLSSRITRPSRKQIRTCLALSISGSRRGRCRA